MIFRKFGSFVAGIIALAVLAFGEVFACSCPEIPGIPLAARVDTALTKAEAVFSGQVLKISERFEQEPFLLVEMSVINVWKGDLAKDLAISTGINGAACGYTFEKGETYLVYSWKSTYSTKTALSTGLCVRTAPISKAKDDLQLLGKPKKTFELSSKP